MVWTHFTTSMPFIILCASAGFHALHQGAQPKWDDRIFYLGMGFGGDLNQTSSLGRDAHKPAEYLCLHKVRRVIVGGEAFRTRRGKGEGMRNSERTKSIWNGSRAEGYTWVTRVNSIYQHPTANFFILFSEWLWVLSVSHPIPVQEAELKAGRSAIYLLWWPHSQKIW